MANIVYVGASQQPNGAFRLIDWLQKCFCADEYSHFRCSVAFAKINPLFKLDKYIDIWKTKDRTLEAIVGIDHQGTSVQALDYMLEKFTSTYILHTFHSTFHPKTYLFCGEENAEIYVGSNNLTPGGIETNFECGVLINLSISDDIELLNQWISAFDELLPAKTSSCIKLTRELLDNLYLNGLLLDESKSKRSVTMGTKEEIDRSASVNTWIRKVFGFYQTKPPRAIPKLSVEQITRGEAKVTQSEASVEITPSMIVNGLVIQVVPHYNGEVFLSKLAINQNPEFFGFPFSGETIPKKNGKQPYPQRIPDPIVNITTYDNNGVVSHRQFGYRLNTVFYEAKSEIRITISPEILSHVPEYSILVMTASDDNLCDYDLVFFAPGSTKYSEYLALCDQTLPSGGKPVARKMGWL